MSRKKCTTCNKPFEVDARFAAFIHQCAYCALEHTSAPDGPTMPMAIWKRCIDLVDPDRYTPGTPAHAHALYVHGWLLSNKPEDGA